MNRKNNVLKNSVILISREEHSRQRAGRVQQAFGSRTDPCEAQQGSPQGWKDGAGVKVTWTRSEGLLGQGHVGPGISARTGYTSVSRSTRGSTTPRPGVDKRAQKGRENPHPSIALPPTAG